ncbi:MAG TPA: glycine betaine ABC transporter substrate-binding protein [Pseudogracilibacillus sp.]|nr:glycine betaine ABC transporter substrate-binding protein [Pseudogracilibacillus sp.]
MLKNFRFTSLVLMLILVLALAACGGNNNASEENNETEDNGTTEETGDLEIGQENITVPYVAWARETISTHMLANLLEQVGYNVDVSQVEAGPMFSSVADGSADFHTSAWFPATHASYWEEYEDDLVRVNETLDSAPLALTVPSYVEDVNTMEDLKDNDEFGESVDWEILGIDPGAGIMQNTEKALDEYELDNWDLTTSSEAAMLTELQTAIENEEPIIVPLWKPHWAFGDMDLKMLEDPKEIYGGEGDQIYTVARNDLEEDAPRAFKVLEQYEESYDMLDEMMPKVYVDEEDVEDVVQDFIDDNPELVDEWLDGIERE